MSERKNSVLLVEDDDKLRLIMLDELKELGLSPYVASTIGEANNYLKSHLFDLVISDLKLPDGNGLELLEEFKKKSFSSGEFILITAFGTVVQAVDALKKGAYDFITKPLDLDHFKLVVDRVLKALENQKELTRLKDRYEKKSFHGLSGRSQVMLDLYQQIETMAKAEGPVLILGESGTGKELVAKALHDESARSNGPFVPVNCASIPSDLFESEFFGHTQGAFTGATKDKKGFVVEANTGTIFLDEISEMPVDLQAKLLRFLQEKKIRPIGKKEIEIDVRVLAATNRDPDLLVKEGKFREDLYYRLETFSLFIPPLRDRKQDIQLLSHGFLDYFSKEQLKKVNSLSVRAMQILEGYNYPGNVRELKSIIERAVTFCEGEIIGEEDLPEKLRKTSPMQKELETYKDCDSFKLETDEIITLSELEQKYIAYVMNKLEGNKRRVASLLGIGRKTLYRRLDESN